MSSGVMCSMPSSGHLVDVHRRAEGQPGDDGHLGRGVGAGHVVGGVGLGVAQPLRLGQRVLVRRAGALHRGQDEVGGAVHDAVHALDVGGGQRLGDHADGGHHAADRGLEAQLHPAPARHLEQLLAVARDQLLVGGHEVLAGLHRAQRVVQRRLGAAHELHDQVAALEDVVEVAAAGGQHAGDLGPEAHLARRWRPSARPRSCSKAAPTVPWPSRPIRNGCGSDIAARQVVVGLAPHHEPRVAVPAEHDRAAAAPRCSCWPSRDRTRRWPARPPRRPGGGPPARPRSIRMSPDSQCMPTIRQAVESPKRSTTSASYTAP